VCSRPLVAFACGVLGASEETTWYVSGCGGRRGWAGNTAARGGALRFSIQRVSGSQSVRAALKKSSAYDMHMREVYSKRLLALGSM
jgi:hypothetical protein